MSTIDEYKNAVTKLANDKTNRRFLNGSGKHAKLLIDLMIGKSAPDDDVLIYSGELNPEYFNNALETAQGKIRILVDDEKGFSVVANLPENIRERIEIKHVTEKGSNHFLISGTAMRYELNHSNVSAVANFKEPDDELQILKAHFDKMWECAVSA